ncbi:MAG TPA: hypothetical protein VHN15_05940 [Thermoanaerobaculia bacterium]|nr:hypothetical protein [Thermoanaerobaculia bacterium]
MTKKTFLFLLALGLLAGGSLAAAETPDPFLAPGVGCGAGLGQEAPVWKAACNVNLTCDVGGYYLSCSSQAGNCQAGGTWVQCDGVRKNCPVCYVQKTCPSGAVVSCFGWTSCTQYPLRVNCDGQDHICPPFLPSS